MKIHTIMGSPRLNGHTSHLVSLAMNRLGTIHECGRTDLAGKNINGCQGCESCQTRTPGHCTHQDGLQEIFQTILAADAVIYATPLYAWSFPAQMKALIDRHHFLVNGYGTPFHVSAMRNKGLALMVTCGGPVESNADLIKEMFYRIADYGRCRCIGTYILPFCSSVEGVRHAAGPLLTRMEEDFSTFNTIYGE